MWVHSYISFHQDSSKHAIEILIKGLCSQLPASCWSVGLLTLPICLASVISALGSVDFAFATSVPVAAGKEAQPLPDGNLHGEVSKVRRWMGHRGIDCPNEAAYLVPATLSSRDAQARQAEGYSMRS